jgi:type VI secretion system protein ImpA
MVASKYVDQLTGEISPELPCGPDLEAAEGLCSQLVRYAIFGQQTRIREREKDQNVDWVALRNEVRKGLSRTRDLRVLPYFAAAVLRTDGLSAFFAALEVAHQWLREHRDAVHPLLEADFNPRLNALGAWSDPWAILDGVRRAPFLVSTAAGDISLRTWFIAHGDAKPVEDADKQLPSAGELKSAVSALSDEEFQETLADVTRALDLLAQIEALSLGNEPKAHPASLAGLAKVLEKIQSVLGSEASARVQRATLPAPQATSLSGSAAVVRVVQEANTRAPMRSEGGPVAEIRSRQDAVRCLAAVRQFFSDTEPSSPIPLLIDRTQRLIDKSCLEVLEELLPDSVNEAKKAAGVKADS